MVLLPNLLLNMFYHCTCIDLNNSDLCSSSQVDQKWECGNVVASAQNFARELMEMPCNYLTPAKFVEIMSEKFSPFSDKMNFTGRYSTA